MQKELTMKTDYLTQWFITKQKYNIKNNRVSPSDVTLSAKNVTVKDQRSVYIIQD